MPLTFFTQISKKTRLYTIRCNCQKSRPGILGLCKDWKYEQVIPPRAYNWLFGVELEDEDSWDRFGEAMRKTGSARSRYV